MAGIAGMVRWNGIPVSGESIVTMLECVRHRGPDGLHVGARGAVGLGHARFVLHDCERSKAQPVWLPDGSCGIVADARIYNRQDLLRELGSVPWFSGPPTDAEILLAAHERWGTDVVQRLRGDFAFALWDARRQKLFAARDPFGAKPFFYSADRQRFCFGSEPKQLLAVPGVRTMPNDAAIAELLVTGRGFAAEATFFEDIVRLRPAHSLEADAEGVRIARWWDPARRMDAAPSMPDAQYPERFYELFRRAVERRLDTDVPIALELSGGYDSSSVVVAAAEAQALGAHAPPTIVTISHHYPGLSCDETIYIEAVVASSPFRAIRFDAPIADYTIALHEELRKCDAPFPDVAWQRRKMAADRLAAESCRFVLTGLGGDELTWDPDYELDLWRSGRFLRAIWHCVRGPKALRNGSARECLARLGRFALPRWLKRVLRRVVPRAPADAPAWVTPYAADLHLRRGAAQLACAPFPSVSQASVHDWILSPGFTWLLESEERLSAFNGLELRHPFLDQDLVEFVLSIPWQARYRQPGSFKTLLVAAMGERLPAELRARHGKSIFDEYFFRLYEAGRTNLARELYSQGRWESKRFVDPGRLQAAYDPIHGIGTANWTDLQKSWLAAMMEIWLRDLPTVTSA